MLSHIISWSIKPCPYDSIGRDTWKLVPGLFSISLNFNLYPFMVINCDCEFNSISEFCESLNKSLKLRGFWGSTTHWVGTLSSGFQRYSVSLSITALSQASSICLRVYFHPYWMFAARMRLIFTVNHELLLKQERKLIGKCEATQ